MFIYKITNTKNGKVYIGKSQRNSDKHRFVKHLDALKYGYHPNKHLLSAYRKYGQCVFEFEIIERTTAGDINDREKFYILLHKSYLPSYGYNKTMGGDGVKPSPELSAKIKMINKGRKHSQQSKDNMSKAHIGQVAWNKGIKYPAGKLPPRTKEHRENLSKALKERKIRPASRKGIKFTEEHKKKLSIAKLGKPSPHKGKKGHGTRNSGSFKKGLIPWNKGIKTGPASEERKKKMSEKMKGRVFTKEHLDNLQKAWKIRKAIGKSRDEKTSACVPIQQIEAGTAANI